MKTKQKFKIVGIGEILWDIYREERYLGGAPANVAIHSRQLGDEGLIVSRIGDDGMGRELIRALQEKRISKEYLQIDKRKGTGTVFIELQVSGEPTFRCSRDVAFDYLEYTPALEQLKQRVDAIVFSSLGQRNAAARDTIQHFLQDFEGLKVFDVNSSSRSANFEEIIKLSLAQADVVKASTAELNSLKKLFHREGDRSLDFSRDMMDFFDIGLFAITGGCEGATLISRDEMVQQPALPIEARDTTGAGDAFTAGLVHKYLRQASLDEILTFANLMGAFICTLQGATPTFTAADVQAFSKQFAA